MPQVESKRSTPRTIDNVVYLPFASDTYVSLVMFASAQQQVGIWLPRGWFEVRLIEEDDNGFRTDHIVLERVAGPPIGSFEVWREAGRFLVERRPEAEGWWDECSRIGRFQSMGEAVEGILANINGQLVAWGLRPL